YLYNAGMLHAKTMIVDDEFVSIGSTNFDFRSFEHNFEANMQIYSEKFNSLMAEIFISDLENCTRIVQTEWKQRPRLKKIEESMMRLFSPIL
ncbi:MAG: cardiolipin synthase, partial [Muribaculaceae bacterium]|nr:cardiolipin synthase [Muribaculaceae bacterium]